MLVILRTRGKDLRFNSLRELFAWRQCWAKGLTLVQEGSRVYRLL